jgi:hypothetical protein
MNSAGQLWTQNKWEFTRSCRMEKGRGGKSNKKITRDQNFLSRRFFSILQYVHVFVVFCAVLEFIIIIIVIITVLAKKESSYTLRWVYNNSEYPRNSNSFTRFLSFFLSWAQSRLIGSYKYVFSYVYA